MTQMILPMLTNILISVHTLIFKQVNRRHYLSNKGVMGSYVKFRYPLKMDTGDILLQTGHFKLQRSIRELLMLQKLQTFCITTLSTYIAVSWPKFLLQLNFTNPKLHILQMFTQEAHFHFPLFSFIQ